MNKQLVALALGLTALTGGSMTNAQAVLSIDPTSQTVSTGRVFNVDVNINNISNLYGYQFDLTFNPSVVSVVSSTEGSFLSKGGSTFFIPGANDSVHGLVSATADTLLGAVPGVSGSGTLAVFTFDAIKPGSSPITLSGGTFLDSAFNAISSQSTGGSITVAMTRAPEIDPASAMSALTLLFGGLAILRGRRPVDPWRQLQLQLPAPRWQTLCRSEAARIWRACTDE